MSRWRADITLTVEVEAPHLDMAEREVASLAVGVRRALAQKSELELGGLVLEVTPNFHFGGLVVEQ